MTIRHCFYHAELVCYSSLYISLNICFLKKPHHFLYFTTFPSSVLMSPRILYFFLLFLHWGQSCRQYLIVSFGCPHAAFLHVTCCSFLDIRCQWVNLVCQIRILLSLTQYCLQSLYALFHSTMRGVILCRLLLLFSHSFCHLEFLALLIVRQQSLQGSLIVVITGISIACFVCIFISFNSYVCRDFTQNSIFKNILYIKYLFNSRMRMIIYNLKMICFLIKYLNVKNIF